MHSGTQDGLSERGWTLMSWAMATMIVLAVAWGLLDTAAAMSGAAA